MLRAHFQPAVKAERLCQGSLLFEAVHAVGYASATAGLRAASA